MDADTLRRVQAPLKERYREEPDAALITLHAQGSLADNEVTCSVQTGRAIVEAGLHPATGGDGGPRVFGCMLLQALVGCAGVTVALIATNRGPRRAAPSERGDLDFRGTLGVDRDAPSGFRAIRLIFELQSPASADELRALIATTERYCVVLQTLAQTPQLSVHTEPPRQ